PSFPTRRSSDLAFVNKITQIYPHNIYAVYFISNKKCMDNILQKSKVLLLAMALTLTSILAANAQGREVTGTVVSGEDNLPLPGVSVLVKGTTRGQVTDLDGRFSLNVQSGEVLA